MGNRAVLDKGFDKGLKLIEDAIVSALRQDCIDLLKEVQATRRFKGFTGQTQTSYMGGLYINGDIKALFNQRNWLERPRRSKVPLNKFVFLENPYEGMPRGGTGKVQIVDPSGTSLSTSFLLSYKPPKNGFAIVITTGTEYSELLETVYSLDVLTGTFMNAPKIIDKNWKKIPD